MNEEKICKYCGKPVESDWTVCPNCSNNIIDETRCMFCEEIIEKDYNICPHCGKENNISEKKGTTCLILYMIGGGIFLHRFYVGKTLSLSLSLPTIILLFIRMIRYDDTTKISVLFVVIIILLLKDFIQLINEKFTDCNGKYVKIDENEIEGKKCKSCGKFIDKSSLICPYCKTENNDIFSEKNGIIYLFLLIFLGFPFLIHRFYIGKVKSAVILLISIIIISIEISAIVILFNISKIIFIATMFYMFIVWLIDLAQFFDGEAKDSKGKYIGIIKKSGSELK